MTRFVRSTLLSLVALAAVVPAAGAATKNVDVGSDRRLLPATVTIAPADTVTWTWIGPDVDHSLVTSPAGQVESFDSDPGGEPNRSVGQTFSKTFAKSGSFTYVCRVHPDRMSGTVVVTGSPVPQLAATPLDPFTGQLVALDASASTDPDGTIDNYEWDLDGNGTFEADTNGVATASTSFATAGAKTVRVRVTDDRGNVREAQRALTVRSRAPVASFTATPASVAKNAQVALDASGTTDPDGSAITAYAWDRDGDGTFEHSTGATATATATFATAGTKSIGLRVTDADGNTGTATRTVTVTNAPPVAGLTAGDAAPLTGVPVTFDASTSSDPDGVGLTFRWDLDNNGTLDTAASATPTVAHTFTRSGSRTVRVVVTDGDGATAQATVTVAVGNRAPLAAFTAPATGVAGSAVVLDASASSDPEATALTYAWDLDGDGTYETSGGASPTLSRAFANSGTLTVGLRVSDADGGSHTTTRTLTITPAPPPPPPPPPADKGTPAAAPSPAGDPAAAAAALSPAPSTAPSLRGLTVAASAPRGQRLGRRGAVRLSVRCDAACTVSATGTLRVRGVGRSFRLAPLTRTVGQAGRVTLTLRVAARDAAALRKALRGGRRATATLAVTAPGAPSRRVRVALLA